MLLTAHFKPGHSVTANMPALGAGDSGFESRCPERKSGRVKEHTVRVRPAP